MKEHVHAWTLCRELSHMVEIGRLRRYVCVTCKCWGRQKVGRRGQAPAPITRYSKNGKPILKPLGAWYEEFNADRRALSMTWVQEYDGHGPDLYQKRDLVEILGEGHPRRLKRR